MELSLQEAIGHYRRVLGFAMMDDRASDKLTVIEIVYESVSSDISNVLKAISVFEELSNAVFSFDMTVPEAVSFIHIMVQFAVKTEIPLEFENLLYPDFEQIKKGLMIIEEKSCGLETQPAQFSYN